MNKLITARTCPYGLKCWAYIDMLESDVERINVVSDELKVYQRNSNMYGRLPLMIQGDRDIYDSNDICAWLLLGYEEAGVGHDVDDVKRDYELYKCFSYLFDSINSSFFQYAVSNFTSEEHCETLDAAIHDLKSKTAFQDERRKISFVVANLAGFLSRFMTYEKEFLMFATTHGLGEWLDHVNQIIDMSSGEYREFGLYFNRFVRSGK